MTLRSQEIVSVNTRITVNTSFRISSEDIELRAREIAKDSRSDPVSIRMDILEQHKGFQWTKIQAVQNVSVTCLASGVLWESSLEHYESAIGRAGKDSLSPF